MSLQNSHSSRPGAAFLVGSAVTLLALILFTITLSPTVNFIDSGELITVGVVKGIAHPPGYPLYTLLSIAAAALPGWTAALKVNFISALSGAAAVGLFYALVYEALVNHVPGAAQVTSARSAAPSRSTSNKSGPARAAQKGQRNSTQSRQAPAQSPPRQEREKAWIPLVAAAGAALLLAFSQTFWNWSTQAKMYSLHFAFIAGLFWLALRARRAMRSVPSSGRLMSPKSWPPAARWLVAVAFVLGLSFTNHFMTYLLLPGLAVLLLWPDKQQTGRDGARWGALDAPWRWFWRYAPALVVVALIPLLLYLYLPIRSAQDPILNWGEPSNMRDFLRHVTVWQYHEYLSPQGTVFDYLGLVIGYASEQLGPLLGAVVLGFALGGIVRLARSNLVVLSATAITLLATLIFGYNYQNAEMEAYSEAMYMVVIFWAGVGFDWFMRAATRWLTSQAAGRADGGKTPVIPYSPQAIALVPVLLALLALVWNIGRAGHYADYSGLAYVHNHLDNLPENAVLITDNWYVMSPTYYVQYVLGERRDVTVIDKNLTRYPFYLDYMDRQYSQALAPAQAEETRFRQQESLWYADQPYDPNLPQYFVDFLRAVVARNLAAGRPVFFEWTNEDSETAAISQGFATHPDGLMLQVDSQPYTGPVPNPKLDMAMDTVPKDRVAQWVLSYYVQALQRMAGYAQNRNDATMATYYANLSKQVSDALDRNTK